MTRFVLIKTWIVAFFFHLPTVLSQPDVRGAQRAFETFLQSQPSHHQRAHHSGPFRDVEESGLAPQRFRGGPSRQPTYRPQGERFYEDTRPRYSRYHSDNDLPYGNEGGRAPKYAARGWKSGRSEDRRPATRQRPAGAGRRDSGYVQSKRGNVLTEIKRNPKIVKYIADKNGFAVREDLVAPLQQTIERTRQESRPRVVTAPQVAPLSQVVTSAIRVTTGGGREGGFRPKVVDMKVGGRNVGFSKMEYTLGEVKKGHL